MRIACLDKTARGRLDLQEFVDNAFRDFLYSCRSLCLHSGLEIKEQYVVNVSVFLFLLSLSAGYFYSFELHSYLAICITSLTPLFVCCYFANKRATSFLSEMPDMIIAVSKSMKTGKMVGESMRDASLLLPEDSLLREEVGVFLSRIRCGCSKEKAISLFAENFAISNKRLVRLVLRDLLEYGGKPCFREELVAGVFRE